MQDPVQYIEGITLMRERDQQGDETIRRVSTWRWKGKTSVI